MFCKNEYVIFSVILLTTLSFLLRSQAKEYRDHFRNHQSNLKKSHITINNNKYNKDSFTFNFHLIIKILLQKSKKI